MAESTEHLFLKDSFIDVLDDFSKLRLYGFKEAARKRFDFSCLLERDWIRPLVGQVAWKHVEGIDKDIRLLVTDKESEIKAYVLRADIKSRMQFEEIVTDLQRSGRHKDLFKIKPFWVPPDFDADVEEQRKAIAEILKSSIVQDILFNVVFGRITADDIKFFLRSTGIIGLNLLLLYEIATNGFINIADMSKRIGVSPGPIREKLIILAGSGFIHSPSRGLFYEVTPKGRLFLDLLRRLSYELHERNLSPELEYVLDKLGCRPVNENEFEANEEDPYVNLVETMRFAVSQWGIPLDVPMRDAMEQGV
jgi:hypothetical protein